MGEQAPCPECGGRLWSTASDGLGAMASVSACCTDCGYITSSWVDLDATTDQPDHEEKR